MANELRTIFIFDEADGNKRVDLTRKNLVSLNNDFNNLGKNISVGKTISNEFRTAGNAAQTFKNKFSSSLKIDEPLKKALNDIKNYQNQTIKGEQLVTKSIEREAKLQSDARIRAGKRSANDAIRGLGNPQVGGGNNFGSSSRSVLGSLPGGSIASGAAFGGGAGAAAAAVLEVINLSKQLTSAVKDLSVESIKLAADFEETTNSLAVFSGSARSAKEELKEVDRIALNTPGLGLVDAEKGYQRLRALNFQAKISQDLIKGLGTQRVLSGASSDSVDRVITNLIQLTSGAGTAADVRQTVGQLPTLLPVFKKAFGTQDFGKINEIAKENPDEFIKKFSAELANAKSAQAGLNVTLEKGKDVLTDLGRAFGEPILDPITKDVKDLTEFLKENRNTLQDYGQDVADVLRGLRAGFDYLANRPGVGGSGLVRKGLSGATYGISEALFTSIDSIRKIGEAQRKAEEPQKLFDSLKQDSFSSRFGLSGKSDDAIKRDQEQSEKEKKKALDERQKNIEFQKKLDLSEIENNLKLGQAVLNANSGNDSLRQIRDNAALEQNSIRQQINAQERFAKSSISNLSPEDFKSGKGLQIARENAEAVAKLNNELAISQINAQKQLSDSGKKLADDFRNSFVSLSGGDNPLVKLMADFDTATERAEKQFGSFGKTVVNQIASIEKANLQKAINLQKFANNLEALDLTQQAEKLRATPENQFAPFQRNLETVERKVDSLSKIFSLNRQIDEAGFYANQFNPNNPRTFNQSKGFDDTTAKIKNSISDILGLKSLDLGTTGIFGKEAVADKILDSIPSRDELLSKLGDPRTSGDARFLLNQQVSALQTKKQAEQQKLTDFLDNQKFLEFGKKFASEKLSEINNSNLTDEQKVNQRLAVTSALGNDLNAGLKKQRAEDLLSAALNKQKENAEAQRIATETRDAVKSVLKILAEKGIKIDGAIPLDINVKNETDSGVETSDRAPNASDTANQYGGNLNFNSGGGFSNR